MVVKMNLRQIVKLKRRQADNMAWSFIRGVCFAVLVYCFVYTYFFIIK